MVSYPPQNAVENAVRSMERRLKLLAMSERSDLEDYRTVSTERGPVRGYEGGPRRGL